MERLDMMRIVIALVICTLVTIPSLATESNVPEDCCERTVTTWGQGESKVIAGACENGVRPMITLDGPGSYTTCSNHENQYFDVSHSGGEVTNLPC